MAMPALEGATDNERFYEQLVAEVQKRASGIDRTIFEFVEPTIVVKQQAIETRMRCQVFVNFRNQSASISVERRQPRLGVGVRGNDIAAMLENTPVGVERSAAETQQRQPREYLDVSARLELPGDMTEKVGPDREMPIGEVDGTRSSISVIIGKGLQEYMADLECLYAIEQTIEVATQLHRIRIEYVIEVYLCHPDDWMGSIIH